MRGLLESSASEEQETHGITGDSNDKNAAIKGHHSEHHDIGEASLESVHGGLSDTGSAAGGVTTTEDSRMGEPLGDYGEEENDDETKSIHTGACPGPSGEENLRVLAPEEGHVHHHHVGFGLIRH